MEMSSLQRTEAVIKWYFDKILNHSANVFSVCVHNFLFKFRK